MAEVSYVLSVILNRRETSSSSRRNARLLWLVDRRCLHDRFVGRKCARSFWRRGLSSRSGHGERLDDWLDFRRHYPVLRCQCAAFDTRWQRYKAFWSSPRHCPRRDRAGRRRHRNWPINGAMGSVSRLLADGSWLGGPLNHGDRDNPCALVRSKSGAGRVDRFARCEHGRHDRSSAAAVRNRAGWDSR